MYQVPMAPSYGVLIKYQTNKNILNKEQYTTLLHNKYNSKFLIDMVLIFAYCSYLDIFYQRGIRCNYAKKTSYIPT